MPSAPADSEDITESDYFRKSSEFQAWLREEKGKYFDQLSGDRARHYFRKFVKAWNRGELSKSVYQHGASVDASQSASSQTAYRWSFANDSSKVKPSDLRAAREAVGQATHGTNHGDSSHSAPSVTRPRTVGPSLPSSSDRTLQREAEQEAAKQDRRASHKRTRERLEDEDGGIGPKQVGREGALEKKRARREDDRDMRNRKEDGGLEVREDVLMGSGSGDSFQAAIARRDAARARWAEKKQTESHGGPPNERREAMKAKDAETMAMLQNLAKQRFG